ncbi:hypothetical protein [Pareuzebyella sediminis]|uniref:hypothetical protein n=1 Tax=Pareuzebyella sediminis TaxID=2607998 RepID=UPI0011EBCEB9|nr:hypothetical protein [Pareuzebyella sediminis]
MTKKELLGKELSNLYAIAKQVNTYFNGSDISFLSKKSQDVLANYVKFSCQNEEETSDKLSAIKVNPGNTTDSIVQEITQNLHEIATTDSHSKEIKEMGYLMSLNRLIGYHVANIENMGYMQHVSKNSTTTSS